MLAHTVLLLALAAAPKEKGPSAEGPEWRVVARAKGPAVKGAPAKLEVELTSRGGFHVNEEYPLYFRPAPSEAVTFAKPRFDRGDGLAYERCSAEGKEACTATLPVTFQPKAPGKVLVEGTLAFSVCNPDRCLIEKVNLSVPIDAVER
jgi:hypothetical protein